ncbi:MAG: preprotein translocase subunit YajC [Candidatus Pacebacteria bacterium]|nr:preprotein translocase subunit YajC [Candidatus Paceibacterota bacterium]
MLVLAAAEQSPAGWQRMVAQFFPFILLFVVLYLLWIRPEQKKAKEHRELIQRIKAGDKVVTSGGIHGTVTGVTEQTLTLKIADNVEIDIQRGAIARGTQTGETQQGKS